MIRVFEAHGREWQFPQVLAFFRTETAEHLYLLLVYRAGPRQVLTLDQDELAATLGITRSTLCYYLRRFQRLSLLRKLQPGGGRGRHTLWRITLIPYRGHRFSLAKTVEDRKDMKENKKTRSFSPNGEKTGESPRSKVQLEEERESRETLLLRESLHLPSAVPGRRGSRGDGLPLRESSAPGKKGPWQRYLMVRARERLRDSHLSAREREVTLTLLGKMLFRQKYPYSVVERVVWALPRALPREKLPPPWAPLRRLFAAVARLLRDAVRQGWEVYRSWLQAWQKEKARRKGEHPEKNSTCPPESPEASWPRETLSLEPARPELLSLLSYLMLRHPWREVVTLSTALENIPDRGCSEAVQLALERCRGELSPLLLLDIEDWLADRTAGSSRSRAPCGELRSPIILLRPKHRHPSPPRARP